jgi:hypothetical protein
MSLTQNETEYVKNRWRKQVGQESRKGWIIEQSREE